MKLLVAAMGSRGDVQPALALARALRAAGHDPVVCAPPDFASWAAQLGLPFESAGANVEEIVREHADTMGGNPVRLVGVLRRIMLDHVPAMLDCNLRAARGVEAIVSANQFLARTVAEVLRLPLVSVLYQPTIAPSAHHPPLMGRWQGAPQWVNRARWWAVEKVGRRVFLEPINRERMRLGLAPADSLARYLFHGVPCMLACDPVIAPSPPDWSHLEIVTTGPWFYDDDTALPPEVEAFLEAGPPPVYVGFGSMASEDPAEATRRVVEGVAAAGRRVLLSKGWGGLGETAESDRVKVVGGPMPHAKLFPRLAAVVHHGGAGTTAAALRAGVPQVLVPHIFDQFYYAHRLNVLGLAPPGIPVGRLTAARLAAAIGEAIALPPGPRRAAAERLRGAEGLARAVDFIERRAGARVRPRAPA